MGVFVIAIVTKGKAAASASASPFFETMDATAHYGESTTMEMMLHLWIGYKNVALENLVLTLPFMSSCDHENIRNMACKEILLTSLPKKSRLKYAYLFFFFFDRHQLG